MCAISASVAFLFTFLYRVGKRGGTRISFFFSFFHVQNDEKERTVCLMYGKARIL